MNRFLLLTVVGLLLTSLGLLLMSTLGTHSAISLIISFVAIMAAAIGTVVTGFFTSVVAAAWLRRK